MAKRNELADKARRALRSHDLGKKHYARADELMKEIAAQVKPGDEIKLSDSRKVVLIDRYAGKDIVWQPCAARKWELKVVNS